MKDTHYSLSLLAAVLYVGVPANAVDFAKEIQPIFETSCYACHGFNGETGRAFVGNWSFNLANEAAFVRFLRYRANVAPPEPSTGMPNYDEKTLSIKQATDIYAYIRTFKSHAPEVKDIPALTQIVNSTSRPYKP